MFVLLIPTYRGVELLASELINDLSFCAVLIHYVLIRIGEIYLFFAFVPSSSIEYNDLFMRRYDSFSLENTVCFSCLRVRSS